MGAWPDLDAYKAWARVDDTIDDSAITASLDAATAAVLARCPTLAATPAPAGLAEGPTARAPGPGTVTDPGPDCPPDVAQAVLLWTNRLVARRNSPSGVVGLDETGQALLAGRDPDIVRLLAPWRAAVMG